MLEGKLRSLSDFEWASVAQYLVYVSSAADLVEFNTSDVYSFAIAMDGVKKVIRRKERILTLLEGNMKQLERFVGRHSDELGDDEKSVLRSLYVQYKGAVQIVREHLVVARECQEEQERGLKLYGGREEDEIPF